MYSPRKTIATAQNLYHRFHLFFPRKDFSYHVCAPGFTSTVIPYAKVRFEPCRTSLWLPSMFRRRCMTPSRSPARS